MKTIKVPQGVQIAVCSDVHAHSWQFFKLMDAINPSENIWIVSCADYFDKGFGDQASFSIIDKMIEYSNNGCGFSVLGNHDVKFLKKNRNDNSERIKWLRSRPLVLSFEFYTGAIVTVLHGGITNKMTWENFENNIEVCYVRDVDKDGMIPLRWTKIDGVDTLVKSRLGGEYWGIGYDGRLGYIASGHTPNKDGKPKYYNHSCNLDCAVFETGNLCAQIFTPEGKLGELITVTGVSIQTSFK